MELYLSFIVQALLSSILTTIMVFLSLRWILPKIGSELSEAISPLTTIGARMAGEKSGESRRSKAIVNSMANNLLNSPKMMGLKMIGKQFGFDLDGMIEEYGALETIQGLSQILGMVGVDPTQFLSGELGFSAKKPTELGLKA